MHIVIHKLYDNYTNSYFLTGSNAKGVCLTETFAKVGSVVLEVLFITHLVPSCFTGLQIKHTQNDRRPSYTTLAATITSSVGPKTGLTAALDTRMSNFPNFETVWEEEKCTIISKYYTLIDSIGVPL